MEFLIEGGILIRGVNEFSKVEKGPGRPPHWELVGGQETYDRL
jgi:putative DNA methylase